MKQGFRSGMLIADLHLGGKGLIHVLRQNPVERINDKCFTVSLSLLSCDDGIPLPVNPDHIEGLPFCQTQSPSLADRVEWNSLMSSQDRSVFVDDGTGSDGIYQPLRQKRMVGRPLDKTDFLTFRFVMDAKAHLKSLSSHLFLPIF